MLVPLILLSAISRAASPGTFAVQPPPHPIPLKFDSPAATTFAATPPLRLVYYSLPSLRFEEADRGAIQEGIRLLKDFYGHFGLEIRTESEVYEVRDDSGDARVPGDVYSYDHIRALLRRHGLFEPHRTVVFVPFDAGLGGDMALVRINSSRTAELECPRSHDGRRPWWCGRSRVELWGGLVHEVGHMFGLRHPSNDDPARARSVMGNHTRFISDHGVGLLPAEVEALRRRL